MEKETALNVKLCSLQDAFQEKCSALRKMESELNGIADAEANRNAQFRMVALTKCLLDKYATAGEKCFNKDVASPPRQGEFWGLEMGGFCEQVIGKRHMKKH